MERQGKLAHRAIVGGEDLNTSAISDASESIQRARTAYVNGETEECREALQLAAEQLDAAEVRS